MKVQRGCPGERATGTKAYPTEKEREMGDKSYRPQGGVRGGGGTALKKNTRITRLPTGRGFCPPDGRKNGGW